ncbi:MAG TPA: glycosyltransferase family 1 protein [Chloroflexota bacterium]
MARDVARPAPSPPQPLAHPAPGELRVGLLAYALARSRGGIGRYTAELCRALPRLGVEVHVLQAGRSGLADATALPGAGRLPGLLTVGQVEIARAVRRHRLALVHDPTGVAPLLLVRGARRVATVHDVIPYVLPETSTTLDRWVYRYWLPRVVRALDAVITVSRHSKADIQRFLRVDPARVHVVPEGVHPRYRPVAREAALATLARYGIRAPYILFVGSVEERKNLPRLLEAYAALRAWSTRWTLVVVGARQWRSSPAFETVRRLGLGPHVRFTGFVPEDDLPALYAGADLFVFPSLYEGFGLPVLEAMACGTPVVASNAASLPEVAGDAALLVDPRAVDALGAAMRRVLTDEGLARALRARGLERARAFTWDRAARLTLAVYQEVLHGVVEPGAGLPAAGRRPRRP